MSSILYMIQSLRRNKTLPKKRHQERYFDQQPDFKRKEQTQVTEPVSEATKAKIRQEIDRQIIRERNGNIVFLLIVLVKILIIVWCLFSYAGLHF